MIPRTTLPILFLIGLPALGQVSFPDFSDPAGLALNGSSATVDNGIDPAPVLRLVPAVDLGGNGGSAFTSEKVCVKGFSCFFEFRIGASGGFPDPNGEPGGDGLTFTIQGVGANALGWLGGGLGYGGLTPSIAVEIDTWQNPGQDPDSNHVGIDADGDLVSLAAAGVPGRFDDGNLRSVWVDYDGVLLEVRVSDTGVRPAVATLARIVDIPGVLGSEAGFVGFTAATFGAYGDHDIVSWSYQGTCGNLTIDGCDTGVENLLFTGGIQLSDLVNACAAQATTHGGFVSCVASLTNGLKQAGILTGRQKGAIQSCAARANLP